MIKSKLSTIAILFDGTYLSSDTGVTHNVPKPWAGEITVSDSYKVKLYEFFFLFIAVVKVHHDQEGQ